MCFLVSPTRTVPQGLLQLAGGRQDQPHPQLCSRFFWGHVFHGQQWHSQAGRGGDGSTSGQWCSPRGCARPGAGGSASPASTRPRAQRGALGAPPLAEGISYLITSRQDNLSNFAWKKSLTNSSKATIMPDETVIEFAFLLLSQLSSCCF